MPRRTASLIADVLGVTDPGDPVLALDQAYRTLFDEPYDAAYHSYIINLAANPKTGSEAILSPTETEKGWDVLALQELLVDRHTQSANTLTDWPAYALMMKRYGLKTIAGASALMVGSLCSLSSRSFQVLAKQEYGTNKAYIVDPESGAHKMRHGTFVRGSGLALDFEDNTIDIVHTNRLLHMLEDPDRPELSAIQKTRYLLNEIVRVLKPNGQLFMVETVPEADPTQDTEENTAITERYAKFLMDALQRRGMSHIKSEPSRAYLDIECLFDNTRNFEKYIVGGGAGSFQLYARKPPASPVAH